MNDGVFKERDGISKFKNKSLEKSSSVVEIHTRTPLEGGFKSFQDMFFSCDFEIRFGKSRDLRNS